MTVAKNDVHLKQVEIWERNNVEGQPIEKQVKLFAEAFRAVEQRTLKTLSSVTLRVILDRVLHQSVEKFPLLSEIKLESESLNFDDLLRGSSSKSHNSEQLVEGLRFLLVEVLGILGSITADILTTALHKELHKVIAERQQPKKRTNTKHRDKRIQHARTRRDRESKESEQQSFNWCSQSG